MRQTDGLNVYRECWPSLSVCPFLPISRSSHRPGSFECTFVWFYWVCGPIQRFSYLVLSLYFFILCIWCTVNLQFTCSNTTKFFFKLKYKLQYVRVNNWLIVASAFLRCGRPSVIIFHSYCKERNLWSWEEKWLAREKCFSRCVNATLFCEFRIAVSFFEWLIDPLLFSQ